MGTILRWISTSNPFIQSYIFPRSRQFNHIYLIFWQACTEHADTVTVQSTMTSRMYPFIHSVQHGICLFWTELFIRSEKITLIFKKEKNSASIMYLIHFLFTLWFNINSFNKLKYDLHRIFIWLHEYTHTHIVYGHTWAYLEIINRDEKQSNVFNS